MLVVNIKCQEEHERGNQAVLSETPYNECLPVEVPIYECPMLVGPCGALLDPMIVQARILTTSESELALLHFECIRSPLTITLSQRAFI